VRQARPSVKCFFGEVAGKFCDGAKEQNGLFLATIYGKIAFENILPILGMRREAVGY
jgi:hypothetical protein